jgi:hypothetical protein
MFRIKRRKKGKIRTLADHIAVKVHEKNKVSQLAQLCSRAD